MLAEGAEMVGKKGSQKRKNAWTQNEILFEVK